MKKDLRGKHYINDGEAKTAVIKWLIEQPTEFYETWISVLIQRCKAAIEKNGNYVEK